MWRQELQNKKGIFMNEENFVEEKEEAIRELVVPGDYLEDGARFKPGVGTYKEHGKIYASQLGLKTINTKANFVNVIPLSGKYIPRYNDMIIGKVIGITPTNWLVDINSPYLSSLHINEVPWNVEFGDTSRFLNIGETILAKIQSVDEVKRVQLTMKDKGLRKLIGGQTMEISPVKVPRIIGRGGSMINLLKRFTSSRIFVGQNGRIWIDGDIDNIALAILAIKKIEKEAHTHGLTDAMTKYLEKITGKKLEQLPQKVEYKEEE